MTVITAEHLGKKYTIGHQRQGNYLALRDVLAHKARGLWQRVRHPLSPNQETTDLEEIWALNDVSFEIKQGERVGIIGRNGAGKSTLLKILSRITHPTTGRVHLKGRVASLLEVGTGFHPELTGRENIYLNGAILGMTRQEIKRKFDEIVAFAEIEKFLDTPVKRYSSGMYVRLAFAVAAHLEPEILLVDEVLAVGDVAFQEKCLGKMENVATREGRTVLFVSHQMAAIKVLCSRTIVIDHGCIKADLESNQAVEFYYASILHKVRHLLIADRKDRNGSNKVFLERVWLEDSEGNIIEMPYSSQDVVFCFECYARTSFVNLRVAFSVHAHFGHSLFRCDSQGSLVEFSGTQGSHVFKCQIPHLPLAVGKYSIGVLISAGGEYYDLIGDCFEFSVAAGDFWGSGFIDTHSPLLVPYSWIKK